MKKLIFILLSSGVFFASLARADDWGCEVLLCLSNPAGPTAVTQCVPPIKKLWRELAKGRAFPTCMMNNSNSSSAQNTWSNENNCPPQYIRYQQNDSGTPYCLYSGVITTITNGQVVMQTWWSSSDSVTQYFGAPQTHSNDQRFDREQSAWQIEQDRIRAQQMTNSN